MSQHDPSTTEQPWAHLVWVEINSLLNRAEFCRKHGKPNAGIALEWCAKAAMKELNHAN